MYLQERIERWLSVQEDYYELLVRLVHAIPDREFYKPDLACPSLKDYSEDIAWLSHQVRVLRQQSDKRALGFLVQAYASDLREVAEKKRLLFLGEILLLDHEEQRKKILELIKIYRLQRFMKRLVLK